MLSLLLVKILIASCWWTLIAADGQLAQAGNVSAKETREAMTRLHRNIRQSLGVEEKTAPLSAAGDHKDVPLTLTIRLEVAVNSILAVDDARQTITSSLLIKILWEDPYVAWHSTNYSGLTSMDTEKDLIWTPHVYLMNSVQKINFLDTLKYLLVFANGQVQAHVDLFEETQCDMNMANYPYDTQVCPLVFNHGHSGQMFLNVSQVYAGSELVVGKVLSYSSQWVLESFELKYATMPAGRSVPSVNLRVRRKTTFYTVCLVLPMTVTSFMNTLVFLLPGECCGKCSNCKEYSRSLEN
jgi:hypothetical protein